MNIHISKDGKRTVRLTKRESDVLAVAERLCGELERSAAGIAQEHAGKSATYLHALVKELQG